LVSAIATEQEHLAEGTGASGPAKRPIAVTFVGVLALTVGSYHAADGLVVLVHGGDANKLTEGALDVALGVLAVAIAIGALRMRQWAWAAFMTWAVVGLTHQLLRHFFYGDPNYLAMALDTFAVLALTPLDVQIAFGARPPRNVVLSNATRNPVDST
jgi:hypothetical protein